VVGVWPVAAMNFEVLFPSLASSVALILGSVKREHVRGKTQRIGGFPQVFLRFHERVQ
jgi:hypothetical protein